MQQPLPAIRWISKSPSLMHSCDRLWCAPTSATMSMSKKFAVRPMGNEQQFPIHPRSLSNNFFAAIASSVGGCGYARFPARHPQQSRVHSLTHMHGTHGRYSRCVGSSHRYHTSHSAL